MEKDISKILSMLIELSMQSDCEQFNMGEWTGQELEDTLADKQALVGKLKRSKTAIKTVPVELIYQAVHDLILYLRTFGPEEGLDQLQEVEHTLARHIRISQIMADAKKNFWAEQPKSPPKRPPIPRVPVAPELLAKSDKPRKIK